MIKSILNSENVIVGDDFDGHIGSNNHGFELVQGGYGFIYKDEAREYILEFAPLKSEDCQLTWRH